MSKTKGKYSRKCALETCRKPFTTDDERKVYHSRACGNKKRSKRWYNAAAAALRSLRKSGKPLPGIKAKARPKVKAKKAKAKVHRMRKPKQVMLVEAQTAA